MIPDGLSESPIMESAAQSRGSHGVVPGAGAGRGGSHGRAGTGRDTPTEARQVPVNT